MVQKIKTAIIGTGTAGLNAYRAVKSLGKTILIEGGRYGTTCARVGCMPSKLLIAAADAAHHAEIAPQFGVHPKNIAIDGAQVMDRVKRERDRFVGFVLESVDNIPSEDKLVGSAEFIAPMTLKVGDQILEAERIIIATGSRTVYPEYLKPVMARVISNEEVFYWNDLPKSLLVIGTGVIGLELAQALHRLGVRVTVMGRGGRIGIFSDPVLRQYTAEHLEKTMDFVANGKLKDLRIEGDQVLGLISRNGSEFQEDSWDYILCAAGRVANLDSLNLAASGLGLDKQGQPHFSRQTLQCGSQPVFLAGDVTNELQLLHEAADEGRHAGLNALHYPNLSEIKRRSPLNIAFTDPQMVVSGQAYSELVPESFATGRVSFENQGRSRIMLVNHGLMHVYGDKESHRFLGAEIYGPQAEHLGHLLSWSHQMKLTIPEMLAMPFYHPVIEEGLRTALKDLESKLQLI